MWPFPVSCLISPWLVLLPESYPILPNTRLLDLSVSFPVCLLIQTSNCLHVLPTNNHAPHLAVGIFLPCIAWSLRFAVNPWTYHMWNQNYSLFLLWLPSSFASSFHSGQPGWSDMPCVLWFFDYGKQEEIYGQRALKHGGSEKSKLQSCLCLLLSWINFSILCSFRIVQRRLLWSLD